MVKFKEYITKIHFPVWMYDIHLIYTTDIGVSANKRFSLKPEHQPDEYTLGFYVSSKDGHNYVIFNTKSTEGQIAHEIHHALWDMFRRKGAELDDETFAYHLTYLLDKALEFKRKKHKYAKKKS